MVMSEGVSNLSIVVVGGVIHVLSMSLGVGVAVDRVVRVVREEQTVPGAVLFVVGVLLITIGLVVSLEHGPLGDVEVLLGDHGGEGSQVGAREPGVLHDSRVNGV